MNEHHVVKFWWMTCLQLLLVQGMKLKPGEQLVSMVVLPPELARTVAAVQAAAKAAEAGSQGDESSIHGTTTTSQSAAVEEAEAPEASAATAAEVDNEAAGSSSSRHVRGESSGPWLLLVTSHGHGKRVPVSEIPLKVNRGGGGTIGVRLTAGDSLAMAHLVYSSEDDIVLASRQGLMARCRAADVRILGRTGKGVRVIALNDGDEVQTVAVVPAEHKTALA